jgi:phytoene synthase
MQPLSPEPADLAACRALLRGGSRSFHAAARLLPHAVAESASVLYAFCRLADDAVDLQRGTLEELRERLARAYDGDPLPIPADRALAAVVARHAIPPALLEALLEGFAWDAEGRRYADLPALHAYAARVAGSVGVLMALLMDTRAPEALARAADLGVAMQLSNIARDVGEDARAGRLYLPLDWLTEAGIEPQAFLAHPLHSPALAGVIARLLAEAEALYDRAAAGIALLPPKCRPAIGAARLLYRAIGRTAGRPGFDPVASRAVVPASAKLLMLARSFAVAPQARSFAILPRAEAASAGPPLPAVRFLLDAVPAPFPPRRASRPIEDGRAAWLLDLFERMQRRERVGP